MTRGRCLQGLLRARRSAAAYASARWRNAYCLAHASPASTFVAGQVPAKTPNPPATAGVDALGSYCSQRAIPAAHGQLSLEVPAYAIWGANTNVGKTLVSAGLAHAAAALQTPLAYIKPVQTGFPADSDARLVALACAGRMQNGPHADEAAAGSAAAGPVAAGRARSSTDGGGGDAGPSPRCSTLFAWRHAVSPHLAVRLEGRAVSDDQLISATAAHVRHATEELLAQRRAATAAAAGGSNGESEGESQRGAFVLLETAGGVTSPAPSGRLACDALRPLRLPCLLVGDPRLGGIAATLSAYDSLTARGWDVEVVVLVGQEQAEAAAPGPASGSGSSASVPLDNLSFLREHLRSAATSVHRLGRPPPEVVGVPPCPPPPLGHNTRRDGLDPHLRSWLSASQPAFSFLLATLQRRHAARVAALQASAAAAEAQFWWPFTQHAGLTHGSATVIDSRCGETWTALAAPHATATAPRAPALAPLYDASCSWWTQAVTPELQPELARAVSYAAGRYMHVLFPEVAHAPALAAAAALLAGPGAGWAERVFFSDDGSTAIEVALKMAFRKFLADRGELAAPPAAGAAAGAGGGGGSGGELLVLGLQGGYHGDTLGAQDCVAPSVFNGPLQAPWYRGRGLFLEPPYVGMRQGRWHILNPPAWLSRHHAGELPTWACLDDMLAGDEACSSSASTTSSASSTPATGAATASAAPLEAAYRSYIEAAMDEFERNASAAAAAGGGDGLVGRLAACILEPLLQGAGGMVMVEPGFQRAMAEVCRAQRLPLILDEVFTGLFRAGHLSAAAALRIRPDIACYAKLLTGGTVPLAATLASKEVFQAFNGPSKLFALLHGHSYTAYPIGAAAAAASMELLTRPETNPNVCHPCRCPKAPRCENPCGRLLPLWDERAVSGLSCHPLVSRVVAIGTVLAVEIEGSDTGYGSSGAVQVVRRLKDEHGIYARPLGSVVYVMVPPTSRRETAAWLAGCLRQVLDEVAEGRREGREADAAKFVESVVV